MDYYNIVLKWNRNLLNVSEIEINDTFETALKEKKVQELLKYCSNSRDIMNLVITKLDPDIFYRVYKEIGIYEFSVYFSIASPDVVFDKITQIRKLGLINKQEEEKIKDKFKKYYGIVSYKHESDTIAAQFDFASDEEIESYFKNFYIVYDYDIVSARVMYAYLTKTIKFEKFVELCLGNKHNRKIILSYLGYEKTLKLIKSIFYSIFLYLYEETPDINTQLVKNSNEAQQILSFIQSFDYQLRSIKLKINTIYEPSRAAIATYNIMFDIIDAIVGVMKKISQQQASQKSQHQQNVQLQGPKLIDYVRKSFEYTSKKDYQNSIATLDSALQLLMQNSIIVDEVPLVHNYLNKIIDLSIKDLQFPHPTTIEELLKSTINIAVSGEAIGIIDSINISKIIQDNLQKIYDPLVDYNDTLSIISGLKSIIQTRTTIEKLNDLEYEIENIINMKRQISPQISQIIAQQSLNVDKEKVVNIVKAVEIKMILYQSRSPSSSSQLGQSTPKGEEESNGGGSSEDRKEEKEEGEEAGKIISDEEYERKIKDAQRKLEELSKEMQNIFDSLDFTAKIKSQGFVRGSYHRINRFQSIALMKAFLESEKFKKFLNMIGRFMNEISEAVEKKIYSPLPEEIDITLTGDLQRVIDDEYINLCDDLLFNDFLYRFTNEQLLSIESKTSDIQKGPIIVCLDDSGSMSGAREYLARAIAIAVGKLCQKQKRDLYVIIFDSEVEFEKVYMSGMFDYDDIIELTQVSFKGGTNYIPPLERSIEIIENSRDERKRFAGADILFLTDGYCNLPESFINEFINKKNQLKTRVYGIAIETPDEGASEDVITEVLRVICDEVVSLGNVTDSNVEQALKKFLNKIL